MVISTLSGMFDVMNALALTGVTNTAAPMVSFRVEIVGEQHGPIDLANGLPITVQRAVDEIDATDIIVLPSVLLGSSGWRKGRYPRLSDWVILVSSPCAGGLRPRRTRL